ncbi:flavin reductase family protein [Microvirga pudoricolor]|uniref:flavin reductase family protein n=1 Tax=Microvirga pudoricolor TaxID=2778729 RepID=UPI001951314E|nr:flavin reductase family protein [Microvirga pudoricolor]MBM6595969.1 flavin reductase [Microvirga pudoricolor]
MLKAAFPSGPPDATLPDPMLFREGMSRVAGAVHIITTSGPAGKAGFTATAVTPVTDDPPSLLVCVNTSARSPTALLENGVFAVNTLAADDRLLSEAFAGRIDLEGRDRFTVGDWQEALTGSPILASSLVSFACRIADARIVATHHVIIGEILQIRLGEPRAPLIYHGRRYHAL